MKSINIIFPAAEKIELCEQDVPALGPDEVLSAAEVSLLSTGTETLCLRGEFDEGTNWDGWVKYPFNPGYSMTGRVIEVGKNVTKYKVGDRVVSGATHNQYFVSKESGLLHIPEGVSDEEATWLSLAITTQLGVRRAKLEMGESVGVIGLGMLGQLVVQYLKNMGCRKIIAIDTVEMRLDVAKKLGATHTLAMTADKAKDKIAEITGGKMLDVVYDITGHPAVLAQALQLLHRLGRVILLGDTTTPSKQNLGLGLISNSLSVMGIHVSARPDVDSDFNQWTYENMSTLFFDYVKEGRMNVKDLITHRYAPQDAPRVYEGLLRDRSTTIGNVFDWSKLK